MLWISLQGDGIVHQQAGHPTGHGKAQGKYEEAGNHHERKEVDGCIQGQDGQPDLALRDYLLRCCKDLLLGFAGCDRPFVSPNGKTQHLHHKIRNCQVLAMPCLLFTFHSFAIISFLSASVTLYPCAWNPLVHFPCPTSCNAVQSRRRGSGINVVSMG
jgi:hypothetical protein